MSNTLTKKELTKYLGPAVVSASDYQSYMWRIENEKGKSAIIKCSREDNCIYYYIDDSGVEHRDGLFDINQLPLAYRTMKYLMDATDGVNTNTKLSYDLVCLLFGEPEVDPDIPFVYKWNRGDYVLESTGNSFSVNRLGEDIRETVNIIGNLPLSYRQVLDSQKVSSALTSVDNTNEETVTFANEYVLAEEAPEEVSISLMDTIDELENVPIGSAVISPVPVETVQEPTLLELSPKDVELLLQNMGSSTVGEEELEEQFKASVTLLAEAEEQSYEASITTDRKQIVVTQEPKTIPEAPEDFLQEILELADGDEEVEVIAEEVTKEVIKSKTKAKAKTTTKTASAPKKLGRPKKTT